MADEEFHEIQLNGKQLVFLFMAGTVAAVVIFLSGLMVGRNVRVPQLEAAPSEASVVDPTAVDTLEPPSPLTTSDSTTPVVVNEVLSYPNRLEAPVPSDDDLTPQVPAREPARAAAAPAPEKPPAAATRSATSSTTDEPAGNGWAVQLLVVNTRPEADTIARRLAAKGYPTFVTPRGTGYGVRVGKYSNRRAADAVKARLEKEEQFKPWVTH